MDLNEFQKLFSEFTDFKKNRFHPLVWILGEPKIGTNVFIGALTEIVATDTNITIGNNCDIASYVSINGADSHKKCLGISEKIQRATITIENNVFIGSHSVIKGDTHIGHHSVIAAGSIVKGKIPPFSLVYGNPMEVKEGYYKDKIGKKQ